MKIVNYIRSLFVKPSFKVLSDILANESSREELLGMQIVEPPSKEQILQDANKIISYSSKADFKVWSKEAWSKVLAHLDAIQNPRATVEEVNFHRGALSGTLDLLRVAYQARQVKEQLERDMKSDSSAR